MPTYETTSRFTTDLDRLTPEQRYRFRRTVAAFVEDLHRRAIPRRPPHQGRALRTGRLRTHLGAGRTRNVVIRRGDSRWASPHRVAPDRDPQHPGWSLT